MRKLIHRKAAYHKTPVFCTAQNVCTRQSPQAAHVWRAEEKNNDRTAQRWHASLSVRCACFITSNREYKGLGGVVHVPKFKSKRGRQANVRGSAAKVRETRRQDDRSESPSRSRRCAAARQQQRRTERRSGPEAGTRAAAARASACRSC